MARIIKNVKDAKIEDLPAKIEEELNQRVLTSYSISSPVLDSSDNKYHVIIIMECFEE